ncbi:MAG: type 4a pilus biogenesis protein PilO [Planctomycetota bacterium]|nr:type 4a pilus biogenesis protein PilO [Planctomycetota bacterium]
MPNHESNAAGGASSTTLAIDALGLGTILTLSALAYFTLIAPAWSAQQLEHRTRLQVDQARDQLASESLRLRAVKAELDRAQAALDDQGLQLRPIEEQNEHLARLLSAAEAGKLNIAQLTPGAVQANALFKSVPLSMSGSSSFQEFVSFLATLRSEFPDTGVASARVRNTDGRAEFSLELVWYAARSVPAARPASAASLTPSLRSPADPGRSTNVAESPVTSSTPP